MAKRKKGVKRYKRELQIIAIIVKKDELAVFSPYDARFVSRLKAAIHPSQRSWTGKYWKLSPYRDAFEVTLGILRDCYDSPPEVVGNPRSLPNFLTAEQEENYYTLLGLEETATPIEVKKGYRMAVRRWHPDLDRADGLGGTEAIFHKITRAYETLSDEEKKLRYDSALRFMRKPTPSPARKYW